MDRTMGDWLHDGQVLCNLVNKIQPGTIKKINTGAMVFKQRENITYFQKFCRDMGVPEIAMFGTDDLFDQKNMNSVTKSINMLGGCIQVKLPAFDGPKLGIAVETHVQDGKRETGPVSQTGGLTGKMEVQKLTAGRREVAGGAAGVLSGTDVHADAAGLDADLAEKKAAKYDAAAEAEVTDWIETITGEKKEGNFHEWLKSGQVLCRLANKIKPGSVGTINTMKTPFKERENITFFQKVMRDFGVPESQLFGTDDLYDDKNMMVFISSMICFGGALQVTPEGANLPALGAATNHALEGDKKRGSGVVSQYEAMQRNMEVERPKNTGITAGADAEE